jgi:tetratricopeptide (TPR) repeat protein
MTNTTKIISALIALVILFFPILTEAQQAEAPLAERADSLYEAYAEEKALERYKQLLDARPNNFEALWRTSFLYSRIGNRLNDKNDQRAYFDEAIDYAEQALQIDSTHTQSNYVMAVAMGRKAIISGARDRVAASRAIKKYADRAIQYDSTNAGAWHVLGRWNLKVANLSWIERAAANTLFGGIPGNASNEKAAEYISKAISYDDQYVLYYHDLATVYEEMGRDQDAIAACEKGMELPNLTPDDPQLKQECKSLIDDLR